MRRLPQPPGIHRSQHQDCRRVWPLVPPRWSHLTQAGSPYPAEIKKIMKLGLCSIELPLSQVISFLKCLKLTRPLLSDIKATRYISPVAMKHGAGSVFTKGLSQILALSQQYFHTKVKPKTWLRPFMNTGPGLKPRVKLLRQDLKNPV